MKKPVVFISVTLLCTAACVALLFMGFRIAAAACGLIAFFAAQSLSKHQTAIWQIYLFVSVALIFGYSLCPTQGFFFMAICLFFVSLIPAVRLLFFEKLGHTGAAWLEPSLCVIAISYYVIGNVFDGNGWISWAFAAPPVAFSSFMTVGGLMDRKQFAQRKISKYAAGVGNNAPDFSLADQDGNTVRLSDYRGKRHVLLIFVRGDWCPTCHIMLRTYEKNKDRFAEKNVLLLAIGPDPVGVNRDMVMRLGVDYKLLSDDHHAAAKAYGMQIQDNNPMTRYAEGIPLPAAFLVDITGVVRYTSSPEKPGEILNPETIFPVIDALRN